ncbi:hypothetical protein M408DRAFT_294024 [Serendipita vermifera MAFF 305830]|uniref:F-box domain-containing protein n=1 Tax=Serendipita vermifera MAFF 305830 TaxID=933852 RepID=A0A0C2W6K0_SERVB|nr:hypothetical protein M408DRAFT_294024 [Serendipita vermifera MAFF 305830]
MLSITLKPLTPPGGMGRMRLLKIQAAQVLYLKIINERVASDKADIATSEAAITNIEQGIEQAQAALSTYKANLEAVQNGIKRVSELVETKEIEEEAAPELGYRNLLRRLNTLSSSGSSRELQLLINQKEDLEALILKIGSTVTSLKQDLHDWQIGLALSQRLLETHLAPVLGTQETLKSINDILSPIRRIPAEIWGHIFQLASDASRLASGKSSLPMVVSQVCSRWRAIALDLPRLWSRIEIPLVDWWPCHLKCHMDAQAKRVFRGPIEFIIPLQRIPDWETQAIASSKMGGLYIHEDPFLYASARYKPKLQQEYVGSSRRDLKNISSTSLCQPFSIHVYVTSDTRLDGTRPFSTPFREPQAFTVEGLTPHLCKNLKAIFRPFTSLRRLTLIDIWPEYPESITSINSFTKLTHLKIEIKELKSLDATPFLSSSLEELDIQYSHAEAFLELPREISLPRLHTLCTTLYEKSPFSKLRYPALKVLKLYAPMLAPSPRFSSSPSGGTTPLLLEQISFVNWNVASNPAPLKLLEVMSFGPTLELVFSRCFIDATSLLSLVKTNPKFTKVTLGQCTGIIQSECEVLKGIVGSLNVYA